jgi:carbamoyl-phosphate synthase small subunit
MHQAVKLVLEDGSEFSGFTFGAERSVAGELVFNTAMTGYPESLTDPSYFGQILVATYPLIGNYGVPPFGEEDNLLQFYESDKIQVTGLVISDYSEKYSHWNAHKSLHQWMVEHNVPGIYGIDTRMLTKIIREKGAMLAKIVFSEEVQWYNPNEENLVEAVSISEKQIYGNGQYRILLVDCGVKNNIIRHFLKRNTTVIRVPWDYDFSQEEYDGLFISNGPGDPKKCGITIKHIGDAYQNNNPIFGICLGNQLMALASGADTYKLKYGHRSHNQPVLHLETNRAYITSQNHGYAVSNDSLLSDWKPNFINLNDQTNEGFYHISKPFFSTQFHPEASSGPTDTEFLFDIFLEKVKEFSNLKKC